MEIEIKILGKKDTGPHDCGFYFWEVVELTGEWYIDRDGTLIFGYKQFYKFFWKTFYDLGWIDETNIRECFTPIINKCK